MTDRTPAPNSLPLAGRYLTVVAVRDGEVHTYDALTTHAGGERVTLRVDAREYPDVASVLSAGRRVTLFYGDHQGAWRVRGEVVLLLDGDRLAVQLSEAPTRGEQRDFIRTTLRLPVWCSPTSPDSEPAAVAGARELSLGIDGEGWEVQEVDISAGGARVRVPGSARSGDYIHLAFALPARPLPFITAARVVRALPSDVVDGHTVVATQYVGMSEDEQDQLFDYIAEVLQGEFGAGGAD